MKITEILSKQIPNLKTSKKPITDIWPKQTVLGIGAQTIAYLHKKYPGKVVKAIQVSGTSDPSYQFLRLCAKHQDNPYFPKIYSMKYYPSKPREDADADFDYEYDDLSPARLENTLIVVTDKLQPWSATSDDLTRLGLPLEYIPSEFGRSVSQKFRKVFAEPGWREYMKIYTSATEPALSQALRLMEPLFKHYQSDMHPGNIMTRPDGQWVFIDPITNIYLGSD